MDYSIVQLGEFGGVPSVSGAYEVACDALEAVDCRASAFRACFGVVRGILMAAVHAAVAVVVDGAVSDVVAVHEVYDVGYCLWIVCGVAVYFHIEYMAAACELVVGRFYFGLVAWRAVVVDGHMIGVGILYFAG